MAFKAATVISMGGLFELLEVALNVLEVGGEFGFPGLALVWLGRQAGGCEEQAENDEEAR